MRGKSSPADDHPSVRLSLEARPENAAVARRAVADEAARAGHGDPLVAAAKVIVTEGFTNAIRHAYLDPGGERVVVHAESDSDGMTIAVRDSGSGFLPRVPEGFGGGGFGLGLIAALAHRVELRQLSDGGTEVRARVERSDVAQAG
ncbi:MAG TPA: ATP-binding protein [Solirubrobacterales bacterium]|nr:ATP-binding protein [Solirubrobacterales bacterium]